MLGETGQGAEFRVKIEAHALVYEWRLDLPEQARDQGLAGRALGFDVVAGDADEKGNFALISWGGAGEGKFRHTELLGDLVLAGQTGRLEGEVNWESGQHAGRIMMKVHALQSGGLWVRVLTDEEGRFAVDLPEGSYHIESLIGRGEKQGFEIDVQQGGHTRADLVLKSPRGAVVPAGRGQGHWRTLSIPDGLSLYTRYPAGPGRQAVVRHG